MRTLLRNGRLVVEDRILRGSVLIEGERIAELGEGLEGRAADRCFDARGAYILPGLVDLHVHLDDRIGRFELADGYRSGSEIAVRNGITTLCSFVTQGPDEGLAEAMACALGKARGNSFCDLAWHLTPTRFEPSDLAFLEGLPTLGWRTLKLYTTYREAGLYVDEARIAQLFGRFSKLGFRFLVHCEDEGLLQEAAREADALDRPLAHARLRPALAEELSVQAVLRLAEQARAFVHVVHVSTQAAAEALAEARARGQKLSCETCPQYLWLDEACLDGEEGHRWICSPPLRRGREDFRALAREGSFDVFATDHCPFCRGDKDDWDRRDVRSVANGLPGLGALLPLVWRLFEDDPDRAARTLAHRVSELPARVAGLWPRKGVLRPGSDADIAVIDPEGPERPLQSSLADVWEPYPGFRTRVHAPLVFRRGRPVVEEGFLVEEAPGGRALAEDPEA